MITINLEGHVALVTGAARGLGAAIARTLADAGASVVVNYFNSADAANAVVDSIRSTGGRAIARRANVADSDAVEALFAHAAQTLGPIDIVVNNVGREEAVRPPFELTHDEYQQMIDLNLHAVVNTCRAAFPTMQSRQWGRIINIASMAQKRPVAGFSAYTAGKAAMIGLSRNLALELGPYNVTVNVVSPGWIVVERHADAPTQALARLVAETPLGYRGEPQHVADAVLFFASPLGDFITGVDLPVAGGSGL